MKAIMRYLTGAALAAAALGAGWPQSASRELSLSDIKAQWPQETLFASALCQRTLDDPGDGTITLQYATKVDPKAFVPDLHTLMEKSEEVILAAPTRSVVALSPSRDHVVTYDEVKVVRSWKGPHHPGDTIVVGLPAGELLCEPRPPSFNPWQDHLRSVRVPGPSLPLYSVFVLFLRHAKGEETTLIQGLFLTAGEGTQGIFRIPVPQLLQSDDDYCAGLEAAGSDAGGGRVYKDHPNVLESCDTFVQTIQDPVEVALWDPLRTKYDGMPVSDFLQEVQSAAGQGLADESSLE